MDVHEFEGVCSELRMKRMMYRFILLYYLVNNERVTNDALCASYIIRNAPYVELTLECDKNLKRIT